MTEPGWWVENYRVTGLVAAVTVIWWTVVRQQLHVVYRIGGKRGVRLRCGITRARRFRTRMREYRKGKDRGSQSWLWQREVWCWLPLPYRLFRLFGDGWGRRCVTVQFVWGRQRVLRIEEAEIRRVLPKWNVQHTGRRTLQKDRVAA